MTTKKQIEEILSIFKEDNPTGFRLATDQLLSLFTLHDKELAESVREERNILEEKNLHILGHLLHQHINSGEYWGVKRHHYKRCQDLEDNILAILEPKDKKEKK